MHPRNIFSKRKPDFAEYAKTNPALEPHLIKKATSKGEGFQYTIDFSRAQSLHELTIATLQHEFGLSVDLPPGHLVPSIPQRLNYIHWVEDIVDKESDVIGIDIGCGPLCIFPLLGCTINKEWRFVATEVQLESTKYALENTSRNNLQPRITVVQVTPDVFLKGVVDTAPYDHTQFTFCMCNPPFYKDRDELKGGASRTGHRPVPQTLNTGNEIETITRGGEVEFVKNIVNESVSIGTRIKWYTSMLGKKESLVKIKNFLKELKVPVILDTTFVQGKTHRWGVAWSYDHSLMLTREQLPQKRKSEPFIVSLPKSYSQESDGYQRAVKWMEETLNKLKIEHVDIGDDDETTWHCTASLNTWSKQRKRKRLMTRIKDNPEQSKELFAELESLDTPCSIEFNLSVVNDDDDHQDCKRIKRQKRAEETAEAESDDNNILYVFEWVSGHRDELHQIVQLIGNWLSC